MLYVDKHRPRALNDLHYHQTLSERLVALVRGATAATACA